MDYARAATFNEESGNPDKPNSHHDARSQSGQEERQRIRSFAVHLSLSMFVILPSSSKSCDRSLAMMTEAHASEPFIRYSHFEQPNFPIRIL